MALNKEKISIINTKGYRYYLIPGLSEPLPSVTSILSTISKPGLISWEKEVAIDYARENILATLAGYGSSADANHITQPAPGGEGGVRAMNEAIVNAEINTNQIDYINAHGTSTPINDKFETMAMKTVFGTEINNIAISSTKSMTGHLLAASGAIEAAISVKSLNENIVPPTINLNEPDPECDLNYTPNKSLHKNLFYTMSNSFGFGGHNCSLIFSKPSN